MKKKRLVTLVVRILIVISEIIIMVHGQMNQKDKYLSSTNFASVEFMKIEH